MAFITGNSSLEPLLEGLLAQIHIDLSRRVFGRKILVEIFWGRTGKTKLSRTGPKASFTKHRPPIPMRQASQALGYSRQR